MTSVATEARFGPFTAVSQQSCKLLSCNHYFSYHQWRPPEKFLFICRWQQCIFLLFWLGLRPFSDSLLLFIFQGPIVLSSHRIQAGSRYQGKWANNTWWARNSGHCWLLDKTNVSQHRISQENTCLSLQRSFRRSGKLGKIKVSQHNVK